MFNPGETIVHSFIIPFPYSDISKVIATYRNMDNGVFYVKEITSVTIEPYSDNKTIARIYFSQDESLLFQQNSCFKIQINVITETGSRFASKEISGQTGPQHLPEVIR